MPANIFIKIIQYIAYEKLDFAMKEVVYELLSIDVNSAYTSNSDQNASSNNMNTNNNNNSSENEANNANNLNNAAGVSSGDSQALNANMTAQSNLSSTAFKTSKENLIIHPLRMEIGLRAFILIADTLQYQRENGLSPPLMPATFNTAQTNETLSIYLQTASENMSRNK